MLHEYVAWGDKLVYNNGNTLYMEHFDFVNFRMETAESCLLLIENRKIADSLGLSRALFENYLLFMLMCRGFKYLRLQDLSSLPEAAFKAELAKKEAEVAEKLADGTGQCLYVKKYPRAKRHLMYVYEGLKDRDDPSFIIPIHFFLFQNFRPEQMRLDDADYFQYYERDEETVKALKGHRLESIAQYRHFLSYDALIQSLEINELVDPAAIARIEAHYTFLGKFLHPTHNAARDLHERSNYMTDRPAIGMDQAYTETAVLLASIYLCYIVAGLLGEMVRVIETAPAEYVREAGAESLRHLTNGVSAAFPYFWFLFNEPPLYDKFNWCVHHATNEELVAWGGYWNAPGERIMFNQYIYDNFQKGLTGWNNARCGEYRSPLF